MRFQLKAFAGSIFVVAALAVVTGAIVVNRGRVHLTRTIEADFQRAPELLQRQLGRRLDAFRLDVGSWAEDKRYAAWLGRASALDSPSGKVAAADLKAAHDGLGAIELTLWSEFQVMNDTGVLLLDARRQDVMGEDRASDPAIRRALNGESVMRLRGELLEMTQAVSVDGTVRGVLLAAIPIEPIRQDLSLALRSEVRFLSSSDPDPPQQAHERSDEIWLTHRVLLHPPGSSEVIGRAILHRSLSRELAPLERDLLTALSFGTAAGLLLALGLAFLLARALSAPIAELVQATRALGRGDFEQRVEPRSRDELGELARAFNQMAAQLKSRVFFESALRRYLAAPVVEQLIAEPERLQLGGERREVTVLFFDVAGFTKLAEALSAEELVALVNGYLDELVAAIFRHGGTFDKFIGDAVMAFWGAPLPQADHAARACRAAIDMQRSFERYTAAHADLRVRSLHCRIGLSSGPAILGNLGSTHVMSYTAMGDTVNVAARLEGVNKIYGTTILAAESTVRAAAWDTAREIDLVRVMGRAEPIRIFELHAERSDPASPSVELLAAQSAYRAGLVALRGQDFAAAQACFRRARELGDGECAALMMQRAATLSSQSLAADWDGSYTLQSK